MSGYAFLPDRLAIDFQMRQGHCAGQLSLMLALYVQLWGEGMPPHPSKLDCSVWTTSYLWPGSASVAHGNEGKADVITASPALLS